MRSGMRGAAWSLLPLVMYLTGSIRLVGRLGSAIVSFAGSFVFSPKAWLGVILFGLAVLLFLISGGIPLLGGTRKRNKARRESSCAVAVSSSPAQLDVAPARAAASPGRLA